MAYVINRYSTADTITVQDGTIDRTLDITLVGKNYNGYGEVLNENLVFMLENFSGTTPPLKPISGQLWYDSANKKIKFYDGVLFKAAAGAEVGATAPSGLAVGDIWWDTTNKKLYMKSGVNDTDFTLIGPQTIDGTTQLEPANVSDSVGGIRSIIKAVINSQTIFVISAVEFMLAEGALTGFTAIKRGITLANTVSTGVTDAQSGTVFWGTASNAKKFDGRDISDFLTKTVVGGTSVYSFKSPQVKVQFGDLGFTLGDSDILSVSSGLGTLGQPVPLFKSAAAEIRFETTRPNTAASAAMTLSGQDILPGSTESEIGKSATPFKSVYAQNFTASGKFAGDGSTITNINATQLTLGLVPPARLNGTYNISVSGNSAGANTVLVTGTQEYVAADPAATANTVVTRTKEASITGSGLAIDAGAIHASFFVGTATQAYYADVAELYLADDVYPVGTVLTIGGAKEVTKCHQGSRVAGVVSASPAILMNTGLVGGTPVALKGRVPVMVCGPVKKGDELVAGSNGTATVAIGPDRVFAVSLETNPLPGVRLVECLVGF